MPEKIDTLDWAKSSLKEIGELQAVQAGTRQDVIRVIDELVDALQLAGDLVSKEISSTLAEYNQSRDGTDRMRSGFLARTAARYSEPSLWLLLHEGKVCGQLHALADRFQTPFSKEVLSSIPAWDAIVTFFKRSNAMSSGLWRLHDGERAYLRDIAMFLDDVRQFAEAHQRDPSPALQAACDELAARLRDKRGKLQQSILELRAAGDDCISKLH